MFYYDIMLRGDDCSYHAHSLTWSIMTSYDVLTGARSGHVIQRQKCCGTSKSTRPDRAHASPFNQLKQIDHGIDQFVGWYPFLNFFIGSFTTS